MCTLRRVVMARVAMLLLESVIRFSSSMLQAVTAAGCFMATYQTHPTQVIKTFEQKIHILFFRL